MASSLPSLHPSVPSPSLLSSALGSRIPDLVRDTYLETSWVGDHTVHLHRDDDSGDDNPSSKSRSSYRAEYWAWERMLGRGGCGEVWTQRCVGGKGNHERRAVKVVLLADGSRASKGLVDYIPELEAISKFSQRRVCFYTRSAR